MNEISQYLSEHASRSAPEPIDREQLLERCMGNVGFAERVLDKFQHRLGEDIRELEDGLLLEDPAHVARIAHRLKGASANVSAESLRNMAEQIESLARSQRLADVSLRLAELRGEWSRVKDFLAEAACTR